MKNYISFKDREKYTPIFENILKELTNVRKNKLVFPVAYNTLAEMVNAAKLYNKRNTERLKDQCNHEIYKITCFDEENECDIRVNIKPKKEYNTVKFFVLEVLQSQYCSKQEYQHFKLMNLI